MIAEHLVSIKNKGNLVMTHYGNGHDGNPEYMGLFLLKLLKNDDTRNKFINKLSSVRLLNEEIDKDFINEFKINSINDCLTSQQYDWFNNYINTSLSGIDVINNIMKSNDKLILLKNYINEKRIKWKYEIDLDSNKFRVYTHDNERLPKEFDIESLPSNEEFLSAFIK